MSNAQRQSRFRKRHPGYAARYRPRKFSKAEVAALTAQILANAAARAAAAAAAAADPLPDVPQ